MKLIRCQICKTVIALTLDELWCKCGDSGGSYNLDGLSISIWGPCLVYGIHNKLFTEGKADAWLYDESNGRVHRIPKP